MTIAVTSGPSSFSVVQVKVPVATGWSRPALEFVAATAKMEKSDTVAPARINLDTRIGFEDTLEFPDGIRRAVSNEELVRCAHALTG